MDDLWNKACKGDFDFADDVIMEVSKAATLISHNEDYAVDVGDVEICEEEVEEIEDLRE